MSRLLADPSASDSEGQNGHADLAVTLARRGVHKDIMKLLDSLVMEADGKPRVDLIHLREVAASHHVVRSTASRFSLNQK